MELADNEKSKKLLKLLEQKRKIEERKRKIVEQIKIEEDRIRTKIGKMTVASKKRYFTMKQAYNMRQEGSTFVEIAKSLDISVSQASLLCRRYSMMLENFEKKQEE